MDTANTLSSSRFWKALLKLINHADFDASRWMQNLKKMVERFCPKARTEDYLRLFMDVYNYHNKTKISLIEDI